MKCAERGLRDYQSPDCRSHTEQMSDRATSRTVSAPGLRCLESIIGSPFARKVQDAAKVASNNTHSVFRTAIRRPP